jgi:hypothetical protein
MQTAARASGEEENGGAVSGREVECDSMRALEAPEEFGGRGRAAVVGGWTLEAWSWPS